ncbi:MAG TPA: hypothetical protein VLB82_14845 [Thermodesulfobacteriota bacterium]|nr:hypothetical protein [Thermodesulfobacteriota bacterium]
MSSPDDPDFVEICVDVDAQELIEDNGSNIIPAGGILDYQQTYFALEGRTIERTNTYMLRDNNNNILMLQSKVSLDANDLESLVFEVMSPAQN